MGFKCISISGPSGTGKTTLIKMLLKHPVWKNHLELVISHTTRKPRKDEKNGREYHFVDRASMLRDIEGGLFKEHVEFAGNLYGTSEKSLLDIQRRGNICLLDINTDAVKKVQKTNLKGQTVFIYIRPPTMEDLRARLLKRGTETKESLEKRLAVAVEENRDADELDLFHYKLVNDDLEVTLKNLIQIISNTCELEEKPQPKICDLINPQINPKLAQEAPRSHKDHVIITTRSRTPTEILCDKLADCRISTEGQLAYTIQDDSTDL